MFESQDKLLYVSFHCTRVVDSEELLGALQPGRIGEKVIFQKTDWRKNLVGRLHENRNLDFEERFWNKEQKVSDILFFSSEKKKRNKRLRYFESNKS